VMKLMAKMNAAVFNVRIICMFCPSEQMARVSAA
jgi:hypothetical protein